MSKKETKKLSTKEKLIKVGKETVKDVKKAGKNAVKLARK